MANSDDYTVFVPCTATNQLTIGGAANLAALTLGEGIDGTANSAIVLDKTGALGTTTTEAVYNDPTGLRIDQEDVFIDLFYIKGKGAAVLTDTNSTVAIRIYCGAVVNDDWIEYYFGGDSNLKFGWQALGCSGLNYDNSSASWADTDITSNVSRVELRLEWRGDGGAGYNPPPLRTDNWRRGTGITMAPLGSTAISFADIQQYSDDNYLGVAETISSVGGTDVGVSLRCGVTLGTGTAGVGNAADLTDAGKFILFQHFSKEVKHDFTITDNSSATLGDLEVGTDDSYATNGVQLVVSEVRTFAGVLTDDSGYANIEVNDGGSLLLYDCKLFRWQDINLGTGASAGAQITLNTIDVDSCNRINFRQTNLEATLLDIHDNRGRLDVDGDDNCGEITKQPDIFVDVTVHDCRDGLYFRESVTVNEYKARDNLDYDLGILEGKTARIVDGEFDATKILRQAT